MAAQPGNQLWKLRVVNGAPRTFEHPEQLWAKCCEYFEWVEANALKEEKLFAYEGDVFKGNTSKMRAMTIAGLLVFIGMSERSWYHLANISAGKDPASMDYKTCKGFEEVYATVRNIIYEQKFTGAAAGQLNAMIIARDLNLREQTDLNHKSEDGSMSPKGELTEEELIEEMKRRGLPTSILDQ